MRRAIVTAVLGGALALIANTAQAAERLVYFGTHANAVYGGRLDDRTGKLSLTGPAVDVERPTWLMPGRDRSILYAVSETGNDGKSQANVYALAGNPKTGELRVLNKVASGGGGATHLALDRRSRTVFVANFGTGTVAALPILADGSLATATSVQADYGTGPHPRQTSPHAHGVTVDPSGHFLLVPDLGADRTFVYRFGPAGADARRG